MNMTIQELQNKVNEFYFNGGYQQGKADGIEEYKNKCLDEIRKIIAFYEKDKQNRPKPDIKSAIAIITIHADLMKGEADES